MNVAAQWVKNIFIIILVVSFMEIILPKSSMEKYVKYVLSLIILATILSPLARILL